MKILTTKSYFLSQPHQPFFLLAIYNAVIMMLLFLLNFKGLITFTIDSVTFHSYSLIFLLFQNAFIGFLFTTFPRFNQTKPIEEEKYTTPFFINILGTLLFIGGTLFSFPLVVIALFILFISQTLSFLLLLDIYKQGAAFDKSDSFWILIANSFGILGHFLFIFSLFYTPLENFAILVSFYMYAIFLGFSVAQRMIPFFSHSFVPKTKYFVNIVFTVFLFITLTSIFNILQLSILLNLILGAFLFYEFKRWQLHPFQSPPILWVLHVALFWLPIGFFFTGISQILELILNTSFYFLGIHLLALGFLTTVLVGFGTRVILGHSNQAPNGDKLATKIFYFIQVIVLLRIFFSLDIAFGFGFNFLFDITLSSWLLLFIIWGGRYHNTLLYKQK
jgi:uncharacterized protein involved in response to NO